MISLFIFWLGKVYLSVDQPTNRNGETYVKIACFADSVKHVELQIRQNKNDNWIPIVEAKASAAHLRTFLRKANYNLGQVSVISQDGLCYDNMCNVDVTMRVHVKPGTCRPDPGSNPSVRCHSFDGRLTVYSSESNLLEIKGFAVYLSFDIKKDVFIQYSIRICSYDDYKKTGLSKNIYFGTLEIW